VDAHERDNETNMAPTTAARLAAYDRRYRKLLDELTQIGYIRSGSLAPRYNYCGKPNCRCHGDPPQPHGPYYQWTAKVNGKTVNRRLSADEAEIYQEWINNDRRLRAIIDELRAVANEATDIILEQARQTDVKV
jgi:Family of unknown function (DUF6788)